MLKILSSQSFIYYLFLFLWLLVLIFLLYKFYKKKIDYLVIKKIIILWVILTFIKLALSKTILFFQWQKDALSKFALPPYSDYFLETIKGDLIYYYETILISFLICLVLFFIAKKNEERFFDYYDIGLVFLGGLIVGWSNLIVFLAGIFIFTIIGYFFLLIIKKLKIGEPLAITTFILLAIIFTLVWGYKLSYLTGLY